MVKYGNRCCWIKSFDSLVFIMDTINMNDVKKLTPPSDGNRILINGQNPIYVAVRTVLSKENFSHLQVQQSDYVYLWSK